jgi:hypothetical protein
MIKYEGKTKLKGCYEILEGEVWKLRRREKRKKPSNTKSKGIPLHSLSREVVPHRDKLENTKAGFGHCKPLHMLLKHGEVAYSLTCLTHAQTTYFYLLKYQFAARAK